MLMKVLSIGLNLEPRLCSLQVLSSVSLLDAAAQATKKKKHIITSPVEGSIAKGWANIRAPGPLQNTLISESE